MKKLINLISEEVTKAFVSAGYDEKYGKVTLSNRPDLCEFQCNEAVAAVDSNGKVTAKKAGTAVITATSSNGKTAGCTVTVKQKEIAITGISLNKSTTSLTEGESETLTATITPSNATGDKTVKWSSSNEAVAAVDSKFI